MAAGLIAAAGGSPWLWAAQIPRDAALAGAWLAAAWGLGGPVVRALGGRPGTSTAGALRPLTMPIGAAVLVGLDGAIFRLHASPAIAWGLTAVGVLVGGVAVARAAPWRRPTIPAVGGAAVDRFRDSLTLAMLAGVAIAGGVLLAAAGSPPGWIWASEFSGYDALSYHLQLPLEWRSNGRSGPLAHNAYAWMPNGMEHATLHLGLLAGDVRSSATAAQLLHAAMAVATALTVAGLVSDVRPTHGSRGIRPGTIAGLFVLGTPWVVITGSLAYTEMMVLWMLAASMRAALRLTSTGVHPAAEGVLHGGLLAAACAAKLTAGPLAVLPAAAWWLTMRGWPGRRALPAIAGAATLTGALVLAPWWTSGIVHAGNPVFPFATGVFGNGPWSAEQVDAWNAGHRAGGAPADLWTQWLDPLGVPGHRDAARVGVGVGAGADQRQARGNVVDRRGQWAALPWATLLGVAGLGVAGLGAAGRRSVSPAATSPHAVGVAAPGVSGPRIAVGIAAMLGLQWSAWLILTHAEARFLLPTVVPGAIAAGVLAADMFRSPRPLARAGGLVIALLAAIGPVMCTALWLAQRGGDAGAAVGNADILAGRAHAEAIADARRTGNRLLEAELVDSAPPAWWINHELAGARVLLIGHAAPFWLNTDRIAYRTVWDRDALSRWLDDADTGTDARPWAMRARADGFTHVLIDRPMLDNWQRRGWNDPRMTWEALQLRAGVDALAPVREFPARGQVIFRLNGTGDGRDAGG
ncbi:MAG: hypothetical protein AB8G96_07060 [Phycisphaerales bacterium]